MDHPVWVFWKRANEINETHINHAVRGGERQGREDEEDSAVYVLDSFLSVFLAKVQRAQDDAEQLKIELSCLGVTDGAKGYSRLIPHNGLEKPDLDQHGLLDRRQPTAPQQCAKLLPPRGLRRRRDRWRRRNKRAMAL